MQQRRMGPAWTCTVRILWLTYHVGHIKQGFGLLLVCSRPDYNRLRAAGSQEAEYGTETGKVLLGDSWGKAGVGQTRKGAGMVAVYGKYV